MHYIFISIYQFVLYYESVNTHTHTHAAFSYHLRTAKKTISRHYDRACGDCMVSVTQSR